MFNKLRRILVKDVCNGAGDPRPNFICPQEVNPERYCLQYDNPYCKFIGDICDVRICIKFYNYDAFFSLLILTYYGFTTILCKPMIHHPYLFSLVHIQRPTNQPINHLITSENAIDD